MAEDTRDDVDAAWKEAVVKYLPDFLDLLFPHIHADVDWSRLPRFLDKELLSIAPAREGRGGKRRVVDALVELHRLAAPEIWVLVHVEIQAQKEAEFERRVYQCNARLCDHYYPQPVCSLVVLADRSPSWRPSLYQSELWGCRTTFSFPTAKLVDLRPKLAELESSTNPFALLVAGTLHIQGTRPSSPQRWAKKFSLLRKMYEAGFSGAQIREFFGMVDRIMKLTPEQEKLFYRELQKLEEGLGVRYISSVERIGLEKGLREGLEQGIEQGIERGIEQGIERGIERGRMQTLRDVARRMRSQGKSSIEIMESTGLTAEEFAAFDDAL